MGLDLLRLLAVAASVVAMAATAACLWVWHQHEELTQSSAQHALGFVDSRLDAASFELTQVAEHVDPSTTLDRCSQELAAQLLQRSLQSSLVRRFELVQLGSPQRCGPEGASQGPPLDELPPAGLSITAGNQIGSRPTLLRPLSGALVLRATLDPHALVMPGTELPADMRSIPLRFVVQSQSGGVLTIRDTRAQPGVSAAALVSTAKSARHSVSVRAQIDGADLDAALWRQALWAVAAALLLLVAVVSWVWLRTLQRARLSHRLSTALRKRQFVPYVQPIVDLGTGRCVGGEVLMRWQHPHRGVLAPAEFIAEAERTGLIAGMSELVMTRAALRLSTLVAAAPDLYFSFNITPQQLRSPDFARQLDQIFRSDTIPRQQVMLELTESEIVDVEAGRSLERLQAAGWRIAVDDFGTGQSSLAALEQLPIDRIKIDRAFVRTIDEGTVKRPVLDAIIALADQLGVPLIAEGVETQSQWDYLAARGVRHAQGFLMSRPLPIDAFVDWLADNRSKAAALAVSAPLAGNGAKPASDARAIALWQQMRMPGGVDLRDRMYKLQNYRQCFVGREAVDWIVQRMGLQRAAAVQLGQRLMALDLIRHVHDEHDFKDENLFFGFVDANAQATERAPASEELRLALRGQTGVAMRDRTRGLVRFRSCASGREIVDWVERRYGVSRSTAVQWAAQLMRSGALRHVFDDRPFQDDRSLYRLS